MAAQVSTGMNISPQVLRVGEMNIHPQKQCLVLAADTYGEEEPETDYWGDPHEQDAGQIWIPESVVEFLMRGPRVSPGQAIDSRLMGVVVDVLRLNMNPIGGT